MSGSAARSAIALVCVLLCAAEMAAAQKTAKPAQSKSAQTTKPTPPPNPGATPKPAPAPQGSPGKAAPPASHEVGPDTSGDQQASPSDVDPKALVGEIDRLKKENQQLQGKLDAAGKERGRTTTNRAESNVDEPVPAQSTSNGPSLVSLLSMLLLLVGLTFQVLLLLRTRPQPLDAMRGPLADIESSVRSLDTSLRHLLAQRDQDRIALEEASRVAEQPSRYAPEPTRDRPVDRAMRDATPVSPAELGFDLAMETSAVVAAPPRRPPTLVGEYDDARNAPDQARAIERFERMYQGTRLSLINSDELRTNPRAIPQFQSHGRGYFLAISEDGRWQCFPWFSFDLTDETYKSVFEYRGTSALRVTRPAILDRQGDMWTLATRGVVENTL